MGCLNAAGWAGDRPRSDTHKPVCAVVVDVTPSQAGEAIALAECIHAVDAVLVGLPYLDHRLRNRFSLSVVDGAGEDHGVGCILGDQARQAAGC